MSINNEIMRITSKYYSFFNNSKVDLSPLSSPVERDNRLDSIRGLLLISMAIDHFGGWITGYTWEPFGYVSDAEGFIFVSGFVLALVYSRHLLNKTHFAKNILKRAFTIYKYHLILVLGFPIIMICIPVTFKYWTNMLSYFSFSGIAKYLISSIVMINKPTFMDILPIYVIFIMMAWPFLRMLFNGMERIALLLCICLWLIGQYIDPIYLVSTNFFPGAPSGIFNVLSWQLLFLSGVYLGFKCKLGYTFDFLDKTAVKLAYLTFVIVMFVLRHSINNNQILSELTNRHNLACLRVLNFFAIVCLVRWILQSIPKSSKIPWVHFLGKHSLQVFVFHIILLYVACAPLGFGKQIYTDYGNFAYCLVLILFVASLSIPAYLHNLILIKKKIKGNYT